MPSQTPTDRISHLEKQVATLTERIDNVRDNVRRDIDRIEVSLERRTNWHRSLMLTFVGILGALIGSMLPELVKAAIALLRN